jgi:hypothetical protein
VLKTRTTRIVYKFESSRDNFGSFKDFVASRTYKLRARSARSSRVQSQKLFFLYCYGSAKDFGKVPEAFLLGRLCSASKEQEK